MDLIHALTRRYESYRSSESVNCAIPTDVTEAALHQILQHSIRKWFCIGDSFSSFWITLLIFGTLLLPISRGFGARSHIIYQHKSQTVTDDWSSREYNVIFYAREIVFVGKSSLHVSFMKWYSLPIKTCYFISFSMFSILWVIWVFWIISSSIIIDIRIWKSTQPNKRDGLKVIRVFKKVHFELPLSTSKADLSPSEAS